MTKQNHPFHLVNPSPWPILGSFSTFSLLMGIIKWFHFNNPSLFILGMISTILIMFQWWRDITRESTYQGHHTLKVVNGLRWGMILFITSEVFFFLAFFWAFFHASLSPNIELGMNWPPKGISTFNPLEIPLLNTLILLSSGLSITWAHHSLMENNYSQAFMSLALTVLLGFYFTILQGYEYIEAPFTITDSIYGSTFYMTTGLHGLHVIIGSVFLAICLIRMNLSHFSSIHHFGFEAAAWYWHFVDVVWLFLYISIYWWGG
uniref:Cytochrome c oxidase subunit 3 n=1 Tax=Polygraphus poligraphus TaxID=516982 RepID=A0A8F4WI33_9CUCU|nr:cytochrome c oxidase subunit III [Polygraphus poligraphus]QXG82898.1 cytochrome c oxidase subunit III [Polygraphus poligraphus]UJX85653.1 cytochrome c oxidase subunit III [Polygraphus poligraphus]